MFADLLEKLKIAETDLAPYRGTNLSGFNGAKTRPLRYVELMLTYDEDNLSHTVKTHFLVLPNKSPHNCIIRRPSLGRLGAVSSTVHLKMKFYSLKNEIITIAADLEVEKRCHYLSVKSEQKAEKK